MPQALPHALGRLGSQLGVAFMRLLSPLPLPLVRGLGWALGWVLYALVAPRRKVVHTNLLLCFPELPTQQRRALAQQCFVYFAQAWLDRSWLWHGSAAQVARRLQLRGAEALQTAQPVVLFAPHFMGLDAGGTALSMLQERTLCSIYTDQANKVIDAWIYAGRQRFGAPQLYGRIDGVRPVLRGLKNGQALYLLPDMDFGPEDSIFVPFYGLPTATVPSVARFARMSGALVLPVVTRMTRSGYQVDVLPAWKRFPSGDTPAAIEADTARMNRELQSYIATMPAQYYWVHKRFKTRPAGAPSVY